MRKNLVLALRAITVLIGFGAIVPAHGQECEVSNPDPITIGIVGGSAACNTLSQYGCEIGLGSGPSVGECTGVAPEGEGFPNPGETFTVRCEKFMDGSVDCELLEAGTTEDFAGWDVMLYEGVSGGQYGQYIFGDDVTEASGILCRNQQGKVSGNTIHVCSDNVNEPGNDPTPSVSAVCTAPGGTVVRVGGVDVGCPIDMDPFQIFTVIVGAEFKEDGTEDPFHGFLDFETGQINSENVCHCIGSGYTPEEAEAILEPCDPSKEVVNGPVIDSFPECPPGEEERGRVTVEFGGSHRMCVGGSCAYY